MSNLSSERVPACASLIEPTARYFAPCCIVADSPQPQNRVKDELPAIRSDFRIADALERFLKFSLAHRLSPGLLSSQFAFPR